MDRRRFVTLCASTPLLAGLAGHRAFAGPMVDYPAAELVDADGAPLKASAIPTGEALIFSYPFRAIPCFLIRLRSRTETVDELSTMDGESYRSPAGVGPDSSLVAFVAICTHQLSYPTAQASFLSYASDTGALADAPGRIVCCAHGSVFDPSRGARLVAGPAPSPLLPVRLVHDPETDRLRATGSLGEAFFQRFFDAYKGDLIERYGPGVYRQPVDGTSVALPQSRYSAVVAGC